MSQAYQADAPPPTQPTSGGAGFWWGVGFSAAAALLAAALLVRPAATYRSDALVLVLAGTADDAAALGLDESVLRQAVVEAGLATDREFTERRSALDDLFGEALEGLGSSEDHVPRPGEALTGLRERAELTALPGHVLLSISATSRDAAKSVRIAN